MSGRPEWMTAAGVETDFTKDAVVRTEQVRRFWLPKGKSSKIIFLTEGDQGISILEHQVLLNGSWQNWVSCLGNIDKPCELCKWSALNRNQYSRYRGVFYTIINTAEYKSPKTGKVYKNTHELFCAKKDTNEKLKLKYAKQRDKGLGLRFALVEATRSNSDKSPSVGDDFDIMGMVPEDRITSGTEELDYGKYLAINEEKILAIVEQLSGKKSYGSSRSSGEEPRGGGREEGTDTSVSY